MKMMFDLVSQQISFIRAKGAEPNTKVKWLKRAVSRLQKKPHVINKNAAQKDYSRFKLNNNKFI